MNSRIIIGDVHACYKTLLALVAKLPVGVPITFVGDLIDRSNNSREVVEFVKDGGHDCVLGNHELMMAEDLKFRTNADGKETVFVDYYHSAWMRNGGDRCLSSYLIDQEEKLESGEIHTTKVHDTIALKSHIEWFKTLPYFIEYKDVKNKKGKHLLVSHSTPADVWGIYSPENPIFKNSVIWDRNNFPVKIPGIYSVYGHTPQKNGATVKDHFANVDTGGCFNHRNYGRLTALQFPQMKLYVQENIE